MGAEQQAERQVGQAGEGRDETPLERLDRNWSELLQELRVVQTGVQLLTGLLLTLPFQPRFESLPERDRWIYLVTVTLSVVATALLIAPVSLHRTLFRQRARAEQVSMGHGLAQAGLAALALAIVGVVALIFDTVMGPEVGSVAIGVAALLFVILWLALPWALRSTRLRHKAASD